MCTACVPAALCNAHVSAAYLPTSSLQLPMSTACVPVALCTAHVSAAYLSTSSVQPTMCTAGVPAALCTAHVPAAYLPTSFPCALPMQGSGLAPAPVIPEVVPCKPRSALGGANANVKLPRALDPSSSQGSSHTQLPPRPPHAQQHHLQGQQGQGQGRLQSPNPPHHKLVAPVPAPHLPLQLPPLSGAQPAPQLPPLSGPKPAPQLPPLSGVQPAPQLPPLSGVQPAPQLPPLSGAWPAPQLPPGTGVGSAALQPVLQWSSNKRPRSGLPPVGLSGGGGRVGGSGGATAGTRLVGQPGRGAAQSAGSEGALESLEGGEAAGRPMARGLTGGSVAAAAGARGGPSRQPEGGRVWGGEGLGLDGGEAPAASWPRMGEEGKQRKRPRTNRQCTPLVSVDPGPLDPRSSTRPWTPRWP